MAASPTPALRAIVAGLAAALAIVAVGCAAQPVADEDTDTPTSVPDSVEPDDASPDDAADSPVDGSDDGDEGAAGERPPPTHDWDDLELEVVLSGGWRLRDCDGDAPLRCLHGADGSVRGVIELLRIEDHDGLIGAYDVDRAAAALEELVADFDAWLIGDRAAGCPQHTVELEPTELISIDGVPAVVRGHRLLTPEGDPVERSLVAYIADGGDLVLVSVVATAPGGCTHVDEIDELTPSELEHLHAELRSLIQYGSIPQG